MQENLENIISNEKECSFRKHSNPLCNIETNTKRRQNIIVCDQKRISTHLKRALNHEAFARGVKKIKIRIFAVNLGKCEGLPVTVILLWGIHN